MCREHLGWRNYFTWAVYTHLTNEEALYRVAVSAAKAGELKEFVEGLIETLAGELPGMVADLLGAALEEVDWKGVAEVLAQEE